MKTESRKITVLGDGGWGTALAMVLAQNGHQVTIWGPFEKYIATILQSRENKQFLPGVPLPPEIHWTADRRMAAEHAEIAVLAVPTKYYRDVMNSFAGLLPPSCRMVSVAKGLDAETHQRMSEVASQCFKGATVAALSGPSHAEEVARNCPTAVCVASPDNAFNRELQQIFSNRHFRVYTSDDIVGIELGGALKNVIAVGVGISEGMGFGHNTRAALMTRGLAEITRLGCALGAKPLTFSGLAGVGDLIVTCTSGLSRNRTVGERLGRGESIQAIMAETKMAVEGIWNCASAYHLAQKLKIEVPITREVYAIVHENKPARAAVESLLLREPKAENVIFQ